MDIIQNPTEIVFDIAITVAEDNKLNAAGGVNIKVLDSNITKEISEKHENIHKINFKIPLSYKHSNQTHY